MPAPIFHGPEREWVANPQRCADSRTCRRAEKMDIVIPRDGEPYVKRWCPRCGHLDRERLPQPQVCHCCGSTYTPPIQPPGWVR